MASGGDDERLLALLPSDESGDLLFPLKDLSEDELLSNLKEETKEIIKFTNEINFDTIRLENPFVETLNNLDNILNKLKSDTITDRNQKLDLIRNASILLDTFNKTNDRLFVDGIDPLFFGYRYNKLYYDREYNFLIQLFKTMSNPHKGGKRRKSKRRKSKRRKTKRRRKSRRR